MPVKNNSNFFLLPLAALCFLSTGCLTAKKMDKWIDKHYESKIADKRKTADYITFNVNDSLGNNVSSTEKRKGYMLPLLFYWQWHYAMKSRITARAPLNNFTASFISYANSKGLKTKLNGRSLELTIHANPANFSMHEKGKVIFFLLGYVTSETIYVTPESEKFSVSYRLLNGAQEVKSGIVSVPNANREYFQKVFQSTRKMVWKHLDACDENIEKMSRHLVDELMYELP